MTVYVISMFLALVLGACGDDNGNNDTILTGFSGVILFGIIAWVIWRYVSKRSNS